MRFKREHKAFYRNTIWQYGLQIIKYALPLLVLPYLTRVLEPEGYAVYAYILSFMSFAQTFIDFGFNLSGTKDVANAKNGKELGVIVGSITQARLILCGIAGLACAIIALNIPIMRDNPIYTLLAYLAVCGRALAPDFLFQGMERMGPLTTRYFVSKGTSTLLTFAFVRSFEDILWVPLLDILASIIALIWSFAAARRLFGLKMTLVPIRRCLKDLAKSGYYCLSNMASVAFNGFSTLLIGIAITDQAQIAYWSLGITSINAAQALYQPITTSLYPHMVAGKDFKFAKRIAFKSIPVVLSATILFAILADPIILVLGGSSYIEGAYVIRMLAPVLTFSFYGVLLGWPILGALGKVRELTRTTVLSSLVSIGMLLMIIVLGLASVALFAIVRSLTEALMCVLRAFECRKAFKQRKESDVA